jgi:putative FmdB family regulatory protein
MPIYEYTCEKCHQRYEKLQKVSDPPCKKCPSCGGPLRKVVSSPAIQFKGQGFYITDYAKKGPADKEKPAGTESEAKGKQGGAKASEAKPAAKAIPADKPCSD